MPSITAAKTYSQALDLISSSTQATLFRINEDGSLRKQTFREKVADLFAGRIVGRFQARKESKDAQVAQALIRLHRLALTSDNNIDRALAAEAPIEEVHVLSRFFEARARIQSRQVKTGEPLVRSDSIASLRRLTQNAPPTSIPTPDPAITVGDQTAANIDAVTHDDKLLDQKQELTRNSTTENQVDLESSSESEKEEFFETEQEILNNPIIESRSDLESSSEVEEEVFFDALDNLDTEQTEAPKAAQVEPDSKALKAQRRFLERQIFKEIRNETRAAEYVVAFSEALRAQQNEVVEHPTGKRILTDSMKDDIESIVSEAQVAITQRIYQHLQAHADEDLDQAMQNILEDVVDHLSDFAEDKIKDYPRVLKKFINLIADKSARRSYLENTLRQIYDNLSTQRTNYPSNLEEVIKGRVDAILNAQVT